MAPKTSQAERAAKIKAVQKEIADAKTEAAELEKKAKRRQPSLIKIREKQRKAMKSSTYSSP